MIKYVLITILAAIALYGAKEAWPLIVGPSLTIDSPIDYASYPSGIVTISGAASHANEITVNGAPVLHDESGSFATILTFPRGGSILTLTAADRFGRTVTATRNIFVPN